MTKVLSLIDSPSPLASLADWEAYAQRMEALAKEDEGAASELRGARRMIAEIKADVEPELRRAG